MVQGRNGEWKKEKITLEDVFYTLARTSRACASVHAVVTAVDFLFKSHATVLLLRKTIIGLERKEILSSCCFLAGHIPPLKSKGALLLR